MNNLMQKIAEDGFRDELEKIANSDANRNVE